MLRNGKVLLIHIGSEMETHEFKDGTDWLKETLVMSAPNEEIVGLSADDWAKDSKLSVRLEVGKLAGGEDFSIQGSLEAIVPTSCSRCTELVKVSRSADFRVYLKLVTRLEDDEMDSGDPDLIYIDHPEFDLRTLISEQLIMLEPFAEVPEEDFEGKAHICAEIQGISPGQGEPFGAKSPFSKLASLKGGKS